MNKVTKLFPLLNRVLIRKLEPQTKTASGIILNDQATSTLGVIVSAGPGNINEKGILQKLSCQEGQTVLLPDFGGTKVKVNGEDLYLYRDSDIPAIVETGK